MPQINSRAPGMPRPAYRCRFTTGYKKLAQDIANRRFRYPLTGTVRALEEAVILGRIQGIEYALRFGAARAREKRGWLIRHLAIDASTATPGAKQTFLEPDTAALAPADYLCGESGSLLRAEGRPARVCGPHQGKDVHAQAQG
jgi:hypothetical protein